MSDGVQFFRAVETRCRCAVGKHEAFLAWDSFGYYSRKMVSIERHGAKCAFCGRKFDPKLRDEHKWDFAHKKGLRNGNDGTDRWGGKARLLVPWTPEWYEWHETVLLSCSKRCNAALDGGSVIPGVEVGVCDDFPTYAMKQMGLFE